MLNEQLKNELGELGQLGASVRPAFPIFARKSSHHFAYLDTAASSQKPQVVIDRLSRYLATEHANIHRGAYALSENSTKMYDEARAKVARFIGTDSPESVIFTRGATEGFNLVANGLQKLFKKGDVILLTLLEHHSNIVPWQLLAERIGLRIEFVDVEPSGVLSRKDFSAKLRALKPKLVSFTAHSNALGTINPVAELTAEAHQLGAWVMVDAAQAVVHGAIDVKLWDADFIAASGHKMYGPTGIGFLYGRPSLLEQMDPFMGGGDMIEQVTTSGSTWAAIPSKFEAGTPAIGEAIALGAAVDFLETIGHQALASHEQKIFTYGFEKLSREKGVEVLGPITVGSPQSAILSFTIEGVHPHDFASIADEMNVQVRAGHHCTQPLWKHLGIQSTVRASVGMYSMQEDFDALCEAVKRARKIFG